MKIALSGKGLLDFINHEEVENNRTKCRPITVGDLPVYLLQNEEDREKWRVLHQLLNRMTDAQIDRRPNTTYLLEELRKLGFS